MAQGQVGMTESPHHAENLNVSHTGPSEIKDDDMRRAESDMSQSHTLTPSRGGTLKKRKSLTRKDSLKRSGSRKTSRPGSVRGLTFADDVDGQGSEMNSAFFTPVPTNGSPTEVLANRFQVWRKVLKDLITYFRDVQKSYDARSKSLYNLSNVITNISAPPQFLSQGGISDAIQVLRDYHKQSITEGNRAKSIEEEVIVQLTGLRSDLGQKIKEIKGLSGDFKNNVDKETEGTRRAVRDLQEALAFKNTDPKNDPYLVRLGVDRQVGRQIEEENYLHRAFLNLESSGRELESIVMGEIQKAYNAYAGIIKREADEAYEAVEKLRRGPLAIPKDLEWNAFVDNNEHFVDPRLPVRRVENITYPGKEDAAASEVKAGMLERKSKYLKSYTPGWYVLSTTHLHEFKSPDRISSQAPVMSLPLADQKLGSHSSANSTSHKFMLKGRQSGGIHRGHTWVFRAESYDTMLTWFEDIRDLTSKAERKEFIRSHARSISAGSHKAGSISSDGGIEEDEADQVPYSATASQVEVPVQEEKPSDRPHPGGRFPSALKVDRDSQLSVSPSSPSSSDDIVVAASELPGSINPSGASGPHVQAQDYETIRGNFAAPLHRDGQSSPEHQREHTPVQHRAELTKAPGLDYNDSSGQMRGILPGGSGAGPDNEPQHQQDDATSRPLPRNMGRHDSKYGDWMGTAATGPGGEAVSATGIEAYRWDTDQKHAASQDARPETQAVKPTNEVSAPVGPPQNSVGQPVHGGIFAAYPPSSSVSKNDESSPSAVEDLNSPVADPAVPIRSLARRPALETHKSVATVSDLHVPGEFPKGFSPTERY